MSIFVSNESSYRVDELALVGVGRFVLDAMGVSPLAELSVLVADSDAMAALHGRYMGDPTPTDVLAFAQDDVIAAGVPEDDGDAPEALVGDVVLCPEYAESNAKAAGHSLDAELDLLLCHGILHLLGFDHGDPDAPELDAEMFGRQAELLAAWNSART